MTSLHQVIALEKGTKKTAEDGFTKAYHRAQKPNLFAGITKSYQPLTEDGVMVPTEQLKVQDTVDGVLADIKAALVPLFDIVATKDTANQAASADITINGTVIAAGVPVSTLLWLEKKLVEIRVVINALPELDAAVDWTWATGSGLWRAEPVSTLRQTKEPKFITAAPATDKHQAVVVEKTEDVIHGTYTTVKLSGATTPQRKRGLLHAVDKMSDAVKLARQTANEHTVTDCKIGDAILGYILG